MPDLRFDGAGLWRPARRQDRDSRPARAEGAAGRKGEPFQEGKYGDDLHCKTDKWNRLERTIDRRNDRYTERITDGETGAVIRDVDEPLSQHRGHGSAKRGIYAVETIPRG